jgi:hypothetical protein
MISVSQPNCLGNLGGVIADVPSRTRAELVLNGEPCGVAVRLPVNRTGNSLRLLRLRLAVSVE